MLTNPDINRQHLSIVCSRNFSTIEYIAWQPRAPHQVPLPATPNMWWERTGGDVGRCTLSNSLFWPAVRLSRAKGVPQFHVQIGTWTARVGLLSPSPRHADDQVPPTLFHRSWPERQDEGMDESVQRVDIVSRIIMSAGGEEIQE